MPSCGVHECLALLQHVIAGPWHVCYCLCPLQSRASLDLKVGLVFVGLWSGVEPGTLLCAASTAPSLQHWVVSMIIHAQMTIRFCHFI
jgi:hypothetical protein